MTDDGRFGAFKLSVELRLALLAEGPLLIKGPDAFVPDAPDMAFIRYPTDYGDVPFLPGSSLKGVLRSGVEMLLRGLGERACRVTDAQDRCKQAENRCRACLLFGSTEGASVVLVEDGLPWPPGAADEERSEAALGIEERRALRAGVGIDRQTGSVRVGPFDYEVLSGVRFYPTIRLRNPEPWQAGALAAGLELLDEGVLRLGSGTTKGLGRVRVEAKQVRLLALEESQAKELATTGRLSVPSREGLFLSYTAVDGRAVLERWAEALPGWLRDA